MPPRKASPSTPVDFSIAGPKVFSNPNYKQKRNKTLKQILAGERERSDRLARERREREIIKVENQNTGGQASLKKQGPVEIMNYNSFDAPPSLLPQKKYCDVTGLEAPYVDPKSTLRFHNAEVYEVQKSFSPGVIELYKSMRGAGTVLR